MPPAQLPPLPLRVTQTHDRLWRKLPIWAQNKVTALAATLNPSLYPAVPSTSQLQSVVQASVASAFPRATKEQSDVLVFFLLKKLSHKGPPSNSGPTYSELRAIQIELQGQLDAMNEMSEMLALDLPMAMDRRSKFVEALSNIMKKIDSTQETIVQNLKG